MLIRGSSEIYVSMNIRIEGFLDNFDPFLEKELLTFENFIVTNNIDIE